MQTILGALWETEYEVLFPSFFMAKYEHCTFIHKPKYDVWASLVAQLVKNPPAMPETGFYPWVGKIPWRKERLPPPVFWPGEFHGLYSPWGRKKLDMTE